MKKIVFLLLIGLLSSGCATRKILLDGQEKRSDEVAFYLHTLSPTLTGSSATYTIAINGGSVQPEHLLAPLKEGQQKFKVSFVDRDNVWLPTYMKERYFQGFYEIEVRTRLGKLYAPVFKKAADKVVLDEICIVEVDQDFTANGIITLDRANALRSSTNYVGCGKANLPAVDENMKICQYYVGGRPHRNEEACKIRTQADK